VTAAYNRDLLQVLDIRSVVTVARGIEPPFPETFKYHVIPVEDNSSEDLLARIPAAIEFIEKSLAEGGNVFVHCANGISRSPTVVTAYLMKTRNLSTEEALAFVSSKRACVDPNKGFIQQLK